MLLQKERAGNKILAKCRQTVLCFLLLVCLCRNPVVATPHPHLTPAHPCSPLQPLHSECCSYPQHHGGPAQKQFPQQISGLAFQNPLHFLETAGCGQDNVYYGPRWPGQPVTIPAHTPPSPLPEAPPPSLQNTCSAFNGNKVLHGTDGEGPAAKTPAYKDHQ